jgi:hypothetical protein
MLFFCFVSSSFFFFFFFVFVFVFCFFLTPTTLTIQFQISIPSSVPGSGSGVGGAGGSSLRSGHDPLKLTGTGALSLEMGRLFALDPLQSERTQRFRAFLSTVPDRVVRLRLAAELGFDDIARGAAVALDQVGKEREVLGWK